MASGVLRFLYQNGFSVPDDVSLIGYDNMGLSRAIYPRLTTIDGMLHKIGLGLGYLLLNKIGIRGVDKSSVIIPKLIVRESSKPKS